MATNFTIAQNFSSSVSNKIDIRTGQYKPMLSLGSIIGNNALGPSLPLTLNYDPQNINNIGFGIGWSLGGASYDDSTNVLTHPNGGNYAVEFPANYQGELGIKYQKTKDFKLILQNDNTELCILNSSGDATVLNYNIGGVSLPKAVFSQSGQKLYLDFNTNNRFTQLRDGDATTVLVEANYNVPDTPTLTMFPGKIFAQTFTFTLDANLCLIKITTNTPETGLLTWTFEYLTNLENQQEIRINNNPTLLAVTYSTGLRESVVYNPNGFLLPDQQTYLPCIQSSSSDAGGGQPVIRKTYQYGPGNNNYLGNGSGIASTSSGDDNLYASNFNEYIYWTEETILDNNGNPSFSFHRTYNKFHLMTEESYYDASQNVIRNTVNTYDASLSTAQDMQSLPSYFQNPLIIHINYTSMINNQPSSKTFSRTREYYSDTYNNGQSGPFSGLLKTETHFDNYKVTYTYYKADGTEAGCPLDANVISPNNQTGWPTNHVKSIEVTHTQTGDSISRMEVEHMPLTTRLDKSFPSNSFLVPKEHRLYTKNTYAAQRLMSYVTEPSGGHYGRPESLTVNTILAKAYGTQNVADVGSTLKYTYNYKFDEADPNNLTTTIVTTGPQNTTTTETHCVYRGNMMKFTDIYSNTHNFTYNNLGLMTQENYNINQSAYNHMVTHDYRVDQRNSSTFNVVTTEISDNSGMKYQGKKTWLDGAGRAVWLDQRVDNSYTQSIQNAYNYFGQLDTTTNLDNLPFTLSEADIDAAIPTASSANASQVKTAVYDLFRTLSGYTLSNGASLHSTYDPATSTTSILNNSASNKTIKILDLINRTVVGSIKDVSGVNTILETTTNYTEYGIISDIEQTLYDDGSVVTDRYTEKYEHDYVGRNTQKTLNDGTIIKFEYDPRFLQALVTKVTYTDSTHKITTLLECTYNARGLLMKRSLTGRDLNYGKQYSFIYDPVFARVTQATLPDGTTWTYTYNDPAGGKVSQIKTNETFGRTQNFTYDRFSNPTKTAETLGNSSSIVDLRTYDSIARPSTVQYLENGTASGITTVTYSDTTSSIISFKDVNGIKTQYTYNDKMQLLAMQNTLMQVSYIYDGYGRLSSKTTWQMQDNTVNAASQHNSNYTYDKKSGYLTIIEEDQANVKTFIIMSYRADGLLTQRTYGSSRTANPWRTETFSYDTRKRLTDFSCVGITSTYLIKDSDGHAVTGQSFSYDGSAGDLNNITKIVTTYLEGGQPKSKTIAFTYKTDNPFLIDTITKNSNTVTISYDACDRALSDDQSRTFTYDGMERLSTVVYNGSRYDLIYDATNTLRIQADSKANKERHFFYDGYNPVSEFTTDQFGTSNRISRFYTDDGLVGQINGDAFAAIPVDAVGNSIFTDDVTTLSSGVTPFGDSYQASATQPNYHGLPYNEALGGYVLWRGYRLYNPRIGRFNKPDSMPPHSSAGINPFAYAFNDPINFFDPSGHMPAPLTHPHHRHIGQYIMASVGALVMAGLAVTAFIPGGAAIDAAAVEGFSALSASRMALKVIGAGAAVVATGASFAGIALENSHPQAAKDCGYVATAAGMLFSGTRIIGGDLQQIMIGRAKAGGIAEQAIMSGKSEGLQEKVGLQAMKPKGAPESLDMTDALSFHTNNDIYDTTTSAAEHHYSTVPDSEEVALTPDMPNEIRQFANPSQNHYDRDLHPPQVLQRSQSVPQHLIAANITPSQPPIMAPVTPPPPPPPSPALNDLPGRNFLKATISPAGAASEHSSNVNVIGKDVISQMQVDSTFLNRKTKCP